MILELSNWLRLSVLGLNSPCNYIKSALVVYFKTIKYVFNKLYLEGKIILKGSYDAFLKIIILCNWCNRICRHALMFKKHLAPPLSNASFSTKSLLLTSTVCSDWPADPEHCDWPNTTSCVGNVTPLSII